MASQVLSGSSNVSYTNNTGQNVRIVINYMKSFLPSGGNPTITMNWGGGGSASVIASLLPGQVSSVAIGRNLAFTNSNFSDVASTASANNGSLPPGGALPTELMLAPGQSFTATCGAYNIVVIPEAG